jgi:hypothetical protein
MRLEPFSAPGEGTRSAVAARHPGRSSRSGIGGRTGCGTRDVVTPRADAVIPAQAGIQSRDVSGMGEQRDTSVGIVSGYGSRAPLKRPRADGEGVMAGRHDVEEGKPRPRE